MKTPLRVAAFGFLLTLTSNLNLCAAPADSGQAAAWKIGTPIVTYWAGPAMTDAVATQMAEGGWNLAWCGEKGLDILQRHGLRGMIQDGLLTPATLDNPERRAKLDALIERVRNHPAMYAWFITDEPGSALFVDLGRLVAYLRERDPAHLAYINLFPTYATNEQLGNKGDVATAYREHLRQYVDIVKPGLISYDHYQFRLKGDGDQYFLNLALIRNAAQQAKLPFLNIVQACTWAPESMRIPNTNELRYLVYTTLAYGAQGISYYVWAHPGHHGSIANLDGTPGPLYHALKSYNPEFVAIARELQPLKSLTVHHTAMREPGCDPLPTDAPFRIDSAASPAPSRGYLLGSFGIGEKPSHVVLVNLDYTTEARPALVGPGNLEQFNAAKAQWISLNSSRAPVVLPPGGGILLRARQ